MDINIRLCTVCGALIIGGDLWEQSGALHAAWHALLERRIEEAKHYYTPPPTYGGRH